MQEEHLGYLFVVYVVGVVVWIALWHFSGARTAMRTTRTLYVPYVSCVGFLTLNGLIVGNFPAVGDVLLEESLFNFLDERARLALQVSASVLVVATIIYGVSQQRFPALFIRLEALSFVNLWCALHFYLAARTLRSDLENASAY